MPTDRHARKDQRDNADRIEPALAAEPIEKIEATEATEPIERIEPAEPMDRIDPVEPMDKMDPLDPILSSEPAEPADFSEPVDPSEPADRSALRVFPMLPFSHSWRIDLALDARRWHPGLGYVRSGRKA
jgi:hypothetical protein